jgi:hypothetical protein
MASDPDPQVASALSIVLSASPAVQRQLLATARNGGETDGRGVKNGGKIGLVPVSVSSARRNDDHLVSLGNMEETEWGEEEEAEAEIVAEEQKKRHDTRNGQKQFQIRSRTTSRGRASAKDEEEEEEGDVITVKYQASPSELFHETAGRNGGGGKRRQSEAQRVGEILKARAAEVSSFLSIYLSISLALALSLSLSLSLSVSSRLSSV